MGRVWRGAVRSTGEAVAVKVLNPELAADPEVVARFLQERGILVGLEHPHLVGVHDLVAEGETLAIVMDLVRGSDLRRHLGEHAPLAPAFAAGLMAQLLTGLAAVHSVGIVHRDLKPENILLDLSQDGPPRALLSDFGIARLTTGPGLTRTTGLIGTPDYMAPEMADEVDVGPPADVYAAGIVLYELLTGRTPFAGGPALAVLRRHVDEAPERPDGLPDALWQLLSEMLAKRPGQRPDAATAADRLVALVPGLLATAPAAGAAEAEDPNTTRLPGHHPNLSRGDPAGAPIAVPLPLGGTGPQRATSAAGDQQMTVLPGQARAPVVPAGPSPVEGSVFRRTGMVVAGVVIAALLVTLVSVGLLRRPSSTATSARTTARATAPTAAASLPPDGRVNDGAFDTDFDRPGEQNGGFAGLTDSEVVLTTLVAPDGTHFLRIVVPPHASGGIYRLSMNAVLSPDRSLTVSIRARVVGTTALIGSLVFGSVHAGVPTWDDKGFEVGREWTTITSKPVTPADGDTGLGLIIKYQSSPGVALDVTDLSYTYHSGPKFTARASASPSPV